MTAYNYSRAAATASRLIQRFGRDMSIVKISRTPADAANRHQGNTSASTTLAVKAVIVDETTLGRKVTGGAVRDVALVAASEIGAANEGETFETLIDGTDIYAIEDTEVLAPGDTRILYQFILGAMR